MAREIRVAIDVRPLALAEVTGVGLVVTTLLDELGVRGVEFVAVTDRPVPEGRLPESVPVVTTGASGGRIRWESSVLPRALRAIDPAPDLFHATWNHGVPGGLPFPSVLTVHDVIPWLLPHLVPWPSPAPLHRWLYRRALRASTKAAALVMTDSEASRKDLVRVLPETAEKTEAVPISLPRRFRPLPPEAASESRAEWNQGRAYWLYLGGFDPRKGIATLLEAMALAFPDPSRAPDLILAGGLNATGCALRAEADRLGVRARFPGYVDDRDLPSLFAGAALFLYPSRYEGFGLPLLMAMASGVPILASDAGSIPEVLGDAGLTFPAGDAGALSKALARAAGLTPEERSAFGERGSARAVRFNPDAFAERILRAYDRALGRRTGSS
ncbi:MAG TPA: glycosyltransferase family 1 protein [Candidatus Eisenbacteria bacterium]|nr:glycosyltransferase family 1 protein [Candidatus Eisenbacteria bacterium]